MTVAFQVPRPWPDFSARSRKMFGRIYWPSIATVWHVDPEADGSEDSCAWTFVRVTDEDLSWAKKRAEHEWKMRFDHDLGCSMGSASNRDVLSSVWCDVLRERTKPQRRGRWIYRPLPRRDSEYIDSLLRSSVERVHGTIDKARENADGMHRLIVMVIRLQRTKQRPWYRHPRWHLHHWKIQVNALLNLKRFLFSRCSGCGNRFSYGYSPSTAQWNGTGPLWFKREQGVYHAECMPSMTKETVQ